MDPYRGLRPCYGAVEAEYTDRLFDEDEISNLVNNVSWNFLRIIAIKTIMVLRFFAAWEERAEVRHLKNKVVPRYIVSVPRMALPRLFKFVAQDKDVLKEWSHTPRSMSINIDLYVKLIITCF